MIEVSDEDNAEDALVIISEGVANLSAPVRTTLLSAVSRLAGGVTAIPAAWLRRYVQGIEDTTEARSLAAKELALEAVISAKTDPIVIEAVKQIYLPDVVRKTINRIRVAEKAAEELSSENDAQNSGDQTQDLKDDWINQFTRIAEDASSEELQSLLGKILAGEVKHQGSYSPTTLRAVAELTQEVARDLAWVWQRSLGSEVLRDLVAVTGEPWARIANLRDAGLLSPIDAGIWQPEFNPIYDGVSPWVIGPGDAHLLVGMHLPVGAFVNVINFTRVGREIGTLLPRPDYHANLLEVANRLPRNGVAWIMLLFPKEKKAETVFMAPGWRAKFQPLILSEAEAN